MKVVFKVKGNNVEEQIKNIIKSVLHKYYKIDDYKLVNTKTGKMYIDGNFVYIDICTTDKYLFMVFDKRPIGIAIKSINNIDIKDRDKYKETIKKEAIMSLEDLTSLDNINYLKYNIKTKMLGKNVICFATYKD